MTDDGNDRTEMRIEGKVVRNGWQNILCNVSP